MKPNKSVALTLCLSQTLTQTQTLASPNPYPNPNPIPNPNLHPILVKDKRKAIFLEHALLRKTQDAEQLQLTLKNAHNDNVVAKRETKKLLRQAHA
jgi:hypothetical protein